VAAATARLDMTELSGAWFAGLGITVSAGRLFPYLKPFRELDKETFHKACSYISTTVYIETVSPRSVSSIGIIFT
jgi:hypothetical protein